MSLADFVQLGCGREWPGGARRSDARGRVEVHGDTALAVLVLDGFNIAP